ncbi:MAG: PAS domain S-box protein [Chitinivibrionales bacterium]|nr:PAS domain S-box protein [Chitinivibrionales bacterium]
MHIIPDTQRISASELELHEENPDNIEPEKRNHFSEFLMDFISSGTHRTHTFEQRRKLVMLNGMFIIGLLFMIPYGIQGLVSGNITVAVIDFAAIALISVSLFSLRASKNYNMGCALGIPVYMLLILFLTIYGGIGRTGYLWSFSLPFIIIFLLGSRKGALVFGLYLLGLLIFFFTDFPPGSTSYTFAFKMRYLGAFLSVYLLATFLDRVTLEYEKRITSENSKYEQASSEVKKAWIFIRNNETTIQTLIDRASDAILIIQNKIIVCVNEKVPELGGYAKEEIIGAPFTKYIHPNHVQEANANYMLRIKGVSIPETYPSVLVGKDGVDINVDIRGGRIMYRGEPADLVFLRKK